jgi:signal transduction histidine kinase
VRLLPDSLFGRLYLAVCIPIIVMLAISYALVLRDRQLLAGQLGGSDTMVGRIATFARNLRDLDEPQRSAAIVRINALQLGPATPWSLSGMGARSNAPTSFRQTNAAVREYYLEPLQKQLAPGCTPTATAANMRAHDVVNLSRPPASMPARPPPPDEPTAGGPDGPPPPDGGPGSGMAGPPPNTGRGLYDITIRCAGLTPMMFRVPSPPELPGIDSRLALQLLILTVVLGAALLFTTRRLTAPLRELQRAADAVGRSIGVPHVAETGAREIRQSLRAFNTMQDRLRRYLESRTRVLAAMSHDLRTPLTRLRLRAETVEPAESRARLVADLEEMDGLVNRSLDLFRGLNEQEAPVEVDMNEFLAGLAEESVELGHTLPMSGQAIRPITVRPLALKRALRNLVENAYKYAGGAELRVIDGDSLAIEVCDHGPGIPMTEFEAVFEPFNRLESSRNRDSGGIGLGLSIARDVAELHRGTLTLRNRASGGLVARLVLPRR